MPFDSRKNYAYSTVAIAPSPEPIDGWFLPSCQQATEGRHAGTGGGGASDSCASRRGLSIDASGNSRPPTIRQYRVTTGQLSAEVQHITGGGAASGAVVVAAFKATGTTPKRYVLIPS